MAEKNKSVSELAGALKQALDAVGGARPNQAQELIRLSAMCKAFEAELPHYPRRDWTRSKLRLVGYRQASRFIGR